MNTSTPRFKFYSRPLLTILQAFVCASYRLLRHRFTLSRFEKPLRKNIELGKSVQVWLCISLKRACAHATSRNFELDGSQACETCFSPSLISHTVITVSSSGMTIVLRCTAVVLTLVLPWSVYKAGPGPPVHVSPKEAKLQSISSTWTATSLFPMLCPL